MATIHTLFNLITTALFLPFVKARAYYLNIAETLAGGKGG